MIDPPPTPLVTMIPRREEKGKGKREQGGLKGIPEGRRLSSSDSHRPSSGGLGARAGASLGMESILSVISPRGLQIEGLLPSVGLKTFSDQFLVLWEFGLRGPFPSPPSAVAV